MKFMFSFTSYLKNNDVAQATALQIADLFLNRRGLYAILEVIVPSAAYWKFAAWSLYLLLVVASEHFGL